MFFSIIIPVYNIEKYLEKCVESVLKQDFQEYEIILVNDGSKDNSGHICDLYAKEYENVKVIHKKNGGLSDARNCGVVNSIGKYILFIDGDDYYDRDFLRKAYNLIEKSGNPDVILCNGFSQFENGTDRIINKSFNLQEERINKLNGEKVLEYLFRNKRYSNWSWSACFNIYKAKYWKSNNFEFKVGTTCEDAELIPKTILLSTKCTLFKENYYCYRLNRNGSIMDSVSEKRVLDMLRIADDWLKYSENISYNNKLYVSIRSKYSNEAFRYIKYLPYFKKEIRSKIIKSFKSTNCLGNLDKPNYVLYSKLIKFIGYSNVSYIMLIESKLLYYIKDCVTIFRK